MNDDFAEYILKESQIVLIGNETKKFYDMPLRIVENYDAEEKLIFTI